MRCWPSSRTTFGPISGQAGQPKPRPKPPSKAETPPPQTPRPAAHIYIYRMRIESARPLEPLPLAHREFLVEVYGPLFGAIGRLALPAPVRLSDFVNEREGFLRLTDVEFATDGDMSARPQKGPLTEYLINKTGIELICQPPAEAIERRSEVDTDYGKSLWQALNKMAVDANADLRVPKERHYVQVHTHRFTVGAYLHLARGASLDA